MASQSSVTAIDAEQRRTTKRHAAISERVTQSRDQCTPCWGWHQDHTHANPQPLALLDHSRLKLLTRYQMNTCSAGICTQQRRVWYFFSTVHYRRGDLSALPVLDICQLNTSSCPNAAAAYHTQGHAAHCAFAGSAASCRHLLAGATCSAAAAAPTPARCQRTGEHALFEHVPTMLPA
jgi:hypothetical protein